jgi:hypothetical protein
MPFRLTNTPATFQAYVNRALAGLIDVYLVVYLDNILIFSKDKKTYIQHVREVLKRLIKWKLFIKLSKYAFHANRVEFLGFVVSRDGVAIDPTRVETIR